MWTGAQILKFIWPFIKELVLGEQTLGQALKTHKLRVLLIALIMGSFVMNVFTVPRLISISADYIKLEKKYEKDIGSTLDPGIKEELEKVQGDLAFEKKKTGYAESILTDLRAQLKLVTAERDVLKAREDAREGKPQAGDRYEYAKEQLRKLRELESE